jgi:tetratricopeptide (TPR) repeat protein
MKRNKQYIFIVATILLAAAVIIIYLVKFYLPLGSELKVYTAAEFPQALERMDQATLELKVEKLNQDYEAIKANDDVYVHWISIGVIKKGLGNPQGAEEAWQKAIDFNPDSILGYGNLAGLYMYEFKDNEKAEEYYKKALELDPTNYNFYYELATLYRYRQPEKAGLIEELINKGAQLNSKQRKTFYNYLGGYFEKEGNDPEKAKYFRQKAAEVSSD